MTENNRKRAPRRTPRAAAFHAEVSGFKHLLPRQYSELALQLFPDLDAGRLRYAVAGRQEYWEGMIALQMAAGLVPLPKGFAFKPVSRAVKQPVEA